MDGSVLDQPPAPSPLLEMGSTGGPAEVRLDLGTIDPLGPAKIKRMVRLRNATGSAVSLGTSLVSCGSRCE